MRFARKDANHNQIVYELRGLGYYVVETHMVGDGMTDIVVSSPTFCIFVEIKTAKGRMNEIQKVFHAEYPANICLIRSSQEFLEYLLKKDIISKKEYEDKLKTLSSIEYVGKPKKVKPRIRKVREVKK